MSRFHASSHGASASETPIEDEEWERAEVTHPFDPNLHQEVIERFHQVIRSTPTKLPEREYGPRLICEKCEGKGFYLTEKRQTKKACTACNETGKVLEPSLGFPCSHCRFKQYCWSQVKLKYEGKKPLWIVPREAVEDVPIAHIHEKLNPQEPQGPIKNPCSETSNEAEIELF